MKRQHDMPFGAQCSSNGTGTVRFRLWAHDASRVDLCLADTNQRLADTNQPAQVALSRGEDGWFELVTDIAQAGIKYQFQIDGRLKVPDPASRFQPQDVHGPSEVIDPNSFDWKDDDWRGRRWEEAVVYELHVGAFTPAGTFSAARERLDYLAELGVTAVELMPIADFPGSRNWGYDGVFSFAPDSTYGRPEDLKEFVQAAHSRGIMVFLDVVYNHFGPEGNYLGAYAPQFFTERHHTPWGNGLNFDGAQSRVVRDFFIQNALYWLTEYHFDGLRFDAVHAIADDSEPDIITELAEVVRSSFAPDRFIHLILENDRNQAKHLKRSARCEALTYTAQWNDDIHHALHVLITGERDGYYVDYADRPLERLGRCLVEGFAYQGEKSILRNGESRGESTTNLPAGAFVSFLQNHDQIGNRALGERITRLSDPLAIRAAAAILLLAPFPPMLFMGEEFGAETPFLFFCDFEKDLGAAVTNGRRAEFAQFEAFRNSEELTKIPDPNAVSAFEASRLDWNSAEQLRHQDWLRFYRELLELRRKHVVPLLMAGCKLKADFEMLGQQTIKANWAFPDGSKLILIANLGASASMFSGLSVSRDEIIYSSEGLNIDELGRGMMPSWSVAWVRQS